MVLPEVRMSFPDRAALLQELDQNLKYGRAFSLQPNDLPVLSDCVLVLVHPEHGQELRLLAQVVMVNPSGGMYGVGIALRNGACAELVRMQEFTAEATPVASADAPPIEAASSGDNAVCATPTEDAAFAETLETASANAPLKAHHDVQTQPALDDEQNQAATYDDELSQAPPDEEAENQAPCGDDTASDSDECNFSHASESDGELTHAAEQDARLTDAELDDELPRSEEQELSLEDCELAADSPHSPATDLQIGNKQERLRHLNPAQQLKVARTGELADRITVERLYGKQVWDALLHNPRISVPEVARIARKGTVPKPLLDVILENGAWIKADAVRRALLSNPKLGPDAVLKLLRITPKHELKTIDKGTAYGMPVREAARKLLKQ